MITKINIAFKKVNGRYIEKERMPRFVDVVTDTVDKTLSQMREKKEIIAEEIKFDSANN